jgi:lipopolysaccharide/colanic/teichoic acid biosynthesis glycosyltransferase
MFTMTIMVITLYALITVNSHSYYPVSSQDKIKLISVLNKISLYALLKRIMDVYLSILLLLFLSPILILCIILNLTMEGWPIFYISKRYISPSKSATICKIRTMAKDAMSTKYKLNERFMRDGYLDIPLTCEVYTKIGRILEKTQLVETLQLVNVLLGTMSFVGNRPLPENNIELLKKFDNWELRFNSPAGITGISQIVGKEILTPTQRLNLEITYANIYLNKNGNIFILDIIIILYTLRMLIYNIYMDYSAANDLLCKYGAITSELVEE